jgi:site-specific DNA recombinase
MNDKLRRVVTYERVSSEDQRERQTIVTQTEELARRLRDDSGVELIERYADDGVSGAIPFADRPAGQRLLADAARGRFQEVWIYRIDRLGRDDIDPLIVRRDLERLGVAVHSVTEGAIDAFMYHIHVAVAAQERRILMDRSAAGMDRAARAGRYTGGIVPYGYKVEGIKQTAGLVPSDTMIWGDWTEAELVRRIYHWLALDEWSCRRVADELNRLGVPTAYQKDGRGIRGKKTQGKWRPGRIRNLVVNPVYKGDLQYGRRSKREGGREVIKAEIEPVVSQEMWDAAQATLAANRIIPKNGRRIYPLRSLIVCGLDGLKYSGSTNRGITWYRCNGQMVERGPVEGRCRAKSIKGEDLWPLVWADIERFLRDPGDLLDELRAEREMNSAAAVAEAQRTTLEAALLDVAGRRQRMIEAYERRVITVDDLEERLKAIDEEKLGLEERLRALEPPPEPQPEPLAEDLLAEIRRHLDAGLDDAQRQKIAQLLVKRITIHTEWVDGRKQARAVVEYRFPAVVDTFTGRDSWRPPA